MVPGSDIAISTGAARAPGMRDARSAGISGIRESRAPGAGSGRIPAGIAGLPEPRNPRCSGRSGPPYSRTLGCPGPSGALSRSGYLGSSLLVTPGRAGVRECRRLRGSGRPESLGARGSSSSRDSGTLGAFGFAHARASAGCSGSAYAPELRGGRAWTLRAVPSSPETRPIVRGCSLFREPCRRGACPLPLSGLALSGALGGPGLGLTSAACHALSYRRERTARPQHRA